MTILAISLFKVSKCIICSFLGNQKHAAKIKDSLKLIKTQT